MLTRRMLGPPSIARLRDEMDRLLARFFMNDRRRAGDASGLRRFPAVNVWQDEERVFVEAELPGLTAGDVEVAVTGNELALRGARSPIEERRGTCVHRRERGAGTFGRMIRLPVAVDGDKVEATLRHGVLTVTLAKAQEARARRIPVGMRSPDPRAEPAGRAST